MKRNIIIWLFLWIGVLANATIYPEDLTWTSQSVNSSESMPCGGGDIGLNVWVENGDILFYVCRSGSFDENNTLLKSGRFRIQITPALNMSNFRQTLKLNDGYVEITDGNQTVSIWCDAFQPVVHAEINGRQSVTARVSYESWRTQDHAITRDESFQTSYKFGVPEGTVTRHDYFDIQKSHIDFWHHNQDSTVFDASVRQQHLEEVKSQLDNPLGKLIFGGRMRAAGLSFTGETDGTYNGTPYHAWTYSNRVPRKSIDVQITLATRQGDDTDWKSLLDRTEQMIQLPRDRKATREWWHGFWKRSYIVGEGECEEYARNYTLFRYMLGCNARGMWPTKFNGGLFCFDPAYVGKEFAFTPDYRRWGGGTHTAQNQRLVYWPMLKNGDFDLMTPQLDFYKNILHNAEMRSKTYWNHEGACFTEQIEQFGLPEYEEYGKNRPEYFDPGIQYNAWLEYTWDTVLEFCQMALDREDYCGMDASRYIPLTCSVLDFFDNHYRYLARKRGIKETDSEGKLILYPGSGAETFKMAYNATSTCCALRTVTAHLLKWMKAHDADRTVVDKYERFLNTIPANTVVEKDGRKMLSPAVVWSRVNGSESTQLYPVYPWREYGLGRKDLDIALNTWLYDPFVKAHEGYESWEQSNIWAACLGQTEDAVKWLRKKLGNGPHRFPAFWGPGHDWTPDHNWGGSGMIGLQEMLIQEVDSQILLFPSWPREWNVRFKLHVSGNTTVEAEVRDGQAVLIDVQPVSRRKDVVIKL